MPAARRCCSPWPGARRRVDPVFGRVRRGQAWLSWRHRLDHTDPVHLGRVVGRKTLFAVAGLVSVHDSTWTTDRGRAATRWGQLHPDLSDGLAELSRWSNDPTTARRQRLADRLDDTVDEIVHQFADAIGLWST